MSRPWYSIFEFKTGFSKIGFSKTGDSGVDSTWGVGDVGVVDGIDEADEVDCASSSSEEDFPF